MKCKYEGSGIWEGRCVGTKEVDPCPGYDKCKNFKPDYKTNADHIRSMTDEELVNVVPCPLGFSMFRCPIERQCGPCKREWLKQPHES